MNQRTIDPSATWYYMFMKHVILQVFDSRRFFKRYHFSFLLSRVRHSTGACPRSPRCSSSTQVMWRWLQKDCRPAPRCIITDIADFRHQANRRKVSVHLVRFFVLHTALVSRLPLSVGGSTPLCSQTTMYRTWSDVWHAAHHETPLMKHCTPSSTRSSQARSLLQLVYDVVDKKSVDSSSKSNPLRRRKKSTTPRREDGGVVVEKKSLKSRRTFNKKFLRFIYSNNVH